MKKILLLSVFILINSGISFSQSGWFFQNPYPTGEYLYTLKFFNENTGIAAGSSGTILKTTNKEINWFSISGNYQNTFLPSYFINDNTG